MSEILVAETHEDREAESARRNHIVHDGIDDDDLLAFQPTT